MGKAAADHAGSCSGVRSNLQVILSVKWREFAKSHPLADSIAGFGFRAVGQWA